MLCGVPSCEWIIRGPWSPPMSVTHHEGTSPLLGCHPQSHVIYIQFILALYYRLWGGDPVLKGTGSFPIRSRKGTGALLGAGSLSKSEISQMCHKSLASCYKRCDLNRNYQHIIYNCPHYSTSVSNTCVGGLSDVDLIGRCWCPRYDEILVAKHYKSFE